MPRLVPLGKLHLAPLPSITTPASPQSGNVTINYSLTDPISSVYSIAVQYSVDNGKTWNTATEGAATMVRRNSRLVRQAHRIRSSGIA